MNTKKISMDDAILKTYNKIAIWHNDDSTKEGLKVLSQEIVEDLLNEALSGLEAQTNIGVEAPGEAAQEAKEKRGWFGRVSDIVK